MWLQQYWQVRIVLSWIYRAGLGKFGWLQDAHRSCSVFWGFQNCCSSQICMTHTQHEEITISGMAMFKETNQFTTVLFAELNSRLLTDEITGKITIKMQYNLTHSNPAMIFSWEQYSSCHVRSFAVYSLLGTFAEQKKNTVFFSTSLAKTSVGTLPSRKLLKHCQVNCNKCLWSIRKYVP